MGNKPRIAAIGECMIELSSASGNLMKLAYGGDTLNTAVYLARQGAAVDYVTALGDDPFSTAMLEFWRAEGVGPDLVSIAPGRVPGLYAIRRDAKGERSFYYWRDRSPAREFFEHASDAVMETLAQYDLLYASGITLSIYSDRGRARLFELFDRARRNGGRVAFDGNYRPRGWSNLRDARHSFEAALNRADFAFPTFDDEQALFGDKDPVWTASRIAGLGVGEVVVKNGASPCVIRLGSRTLTVPAEPAVTPVDTTAAGDSFNAGYLAARLSGKEPEAAARAGHRLAAEVIRHPGAIIPRGNTDKGSS